MDITYFGHSCFLIENQKTSILIDPFYDAEKFSPHPDYVVVTHGHQDHFGHSEKLCSAGANFIGIFELCNYLEARGVPNTHPMNIGGFGNFGNFKLKFVPATHTSSLDGIHSSGCAAGLVLEIDDKTIYHAGDTGLFGDMALIGARHKINIAMLPIGGNFTMDADDAAYACGLIKPEVAIPMHYSTFPAIQANPNDFTDKLPNNIKGIVFKIGEKKEF